MHVCSQINPDGWYYKSNITSLFLQNSSIFSYLSSSNRVQSNKDISAYTYERTVNMAERNKMMEYMGLTKRVNILISPSSLLVFTFIFLHLPLSCLKIHFTVLTVVFTIILLKDRTSLSSQPFQNIAF